MTGGGKDRHNRQLIYPGIVTDIIGAALVGGVLLWRKLQKT